MKRIVIACFVCLAAFVLFGGCGGGGDGKYVPTCEDLACQLAAGGWELWVIQEGDQCATPLCDRTGDNALRPQVDTWFLAKICAANGKPAYLLDFRCLPCKECIFCLRGQIDQEEPVTGSFDFKYGNAQTPVCSPVLFDAENARWMTTRGIKLTIRDVEKPLGEPYSFNTK